MLLTSIAIQFWTANSQLTVLSSNKSSSPDLVGGSNGAECKMKYTDTGYEEALGCDFDMSTHLYGQGTDTYPSTDPFDRSFYVQWPTQVVIASFYINSAVAFNWVDIYISDVFPFTRNDPNLLVFT